MCIHLIQIDTCHISCSMLNTVKVDMAFTTLRQEEDELEHKENEEDDEEEQEGEGRAMRRTSNNSTTRRAKSQTPNSSYIQIG